MRTEELLTELYGSRCQTQEELILFLSTNEKKFEVFPDEQMRKVLRHKSPLDPRKYLAG